jgi:uncharacterized protein YfaS (alpha-2-macroglobulin family)
MIFNAQFNYDAEWKKIEKNTEKGNYKSNLPLVKAIENQAIKDKNYPEHYRALAQKLAIENTVKEESSVDEVNNPLYLNELKKTALAQKDVVYQNILLHLYATNLIAYYNNQSWEIQNRTNLTKVSENISEWTNENFKTEIFKTFDDIFKKKNDLLGTDLKNWVKIIEPEKFDDFKLNLFHLMFNTYLNIPEALMDDAEEKNYQIQINSHFEDLVKNYQSKQLLDAFLYTQNQWLDHKKNSNQITLIAYQKVLAQLISNYQADYVAQLSYILANTYITQTGRNYFQGRNNPEQAKSDFLKAKDILEQAIKKHSKSKWTKNCENLLLRVKQPEIEVQMPNKILVNEQIPLGISHRNTDKIYVRIYNISQTPSTYIDYNFIDKEDANLETNAKIFSETTIPVKNFTDLQTHSTLFHLPSLPIGKYVLAFSSNANFKNGKSDFTTRINLDIIENYIFNTNDDKGQRSNAQIINANSGLPFANETLDIYELKDKKFTFYKTYKTNEIGDIIDGNEVLSITNQRYYGYYIFIPKTKEFYRLSDFGQYRSNYQPNETQQTVATIFTDRAIYRPGQVVYFKAIAYEKLKSESKLLVNQNFRVELKNVNNEKVAELNLITNEFGSINGQFVLPLSTLTGDFQLLIFDKNETVVGQTSISVEEYKRPKFEVKFNELKDNYTLKTEQKVVGTAMAYSGASISNAKVIYRVERQEIFVFPWWDGFRCYYPPYRHAEPETITQGEGTTNEKGEFTINFNTEIPENEIESKQPKTYTYQVFADVTDLNGETQKGDVSLTAGSLPKKLNIESEASFAVNGLTNEHFKIVSTNLNNVKVAAKGTYKITKLIAPSRLVTPETFYFEADYQLVEEAKFDQLFPHLNYKKDEGDKNFWKKGEVIMGNSFENDANTTTENWSKVKIPALKSGHYLIESFEMYENDTIRAFKIIEVYDHQTLSNGSPNYFSHKLDKKTYKVGESAKITFSTDTKDAVLYFALEEKNQLSEKKILTFKNGEATLLLPVTKENKDGLVCHVLFIKHNDGVTKTITMPVDKEEPKLEISTVVFRDKLQPGQPEKWQLKISGKDSEKISAELLATMYDQSLDQFRPHDYGFNPFSYYYYGFQNVFTLSNQSWQLNNTYGRRFMNYNFINPIIPIFKNEINGFYGRGRNQLFKSMPGSVATMSKSQEELTLGLDYKNTVDALQGSAAGVVVRGYNSMDKSHEFLIKEEIVPKNPKTDFSTVQVRTNLNETAFFFPQLRTNEKGEVILEFTSPESLTQWKVLLLAHTKDLAVGQKTLSVKTQKELMVVPNAPRFLRENDELILSTKISNLSDKNLSGEVVLQLFDAFSMKAVDDRFGMKQTVVPFTVEKGLNTAVSWTIKVPANLGAVVYRIIAKTADFSDGEENVLPILPNQMLVTETIPISVREGQTKTFSFDKLKNNTSSTLRSHALTLNLNTNPIWLAVSSLPYLREFPYDCSEQLFSRLYGNMLSSFIINQQPKIKRVFDLWNSKDMMMSKLSQNQELKSMVLEETPWLKEAQDETQQMKQLALFFDLNTMTNEFKTTMNKLLSRQMASGGFPWFDGGKESFNITAHIVGGFGKLNQLTGDQYQAIIGEDGKQMLAKAINYLDVEALKNYNEAKRRKPQFYASYDLIQYLYARSYWLKQYPLAKNKALATDVIKDAIKNQAKSQLQSQAQLAVVLQRYDYKKEAQKIITFLKETAVDSPENGMYWKNNLSGWRWYESPVETQSMILEAFHEITPNDGKSIEDMKVWLIKNKQTNSWSSTKSTAEAVYALMYAGKSWVNAEENVKITAPSFTLPTDELAQSGLIKAKINSAEIKPNASEVTIQKTGAGVVLGGLYWQYFENLDKITKHQGGISLQKQLYLKKNTDQGQQLQEITANQPIKIGDLVTVRLIIKVDRDMEFIHLKDMRASGFEPTSTLSGYKWSAGLGYYQSTRDASTNFFIDYMPRGNYVFEYDLRANNAGQFSNGITTLQNMYAPEMASHSAGIVVKIEE